MELGTVRLGEAQQHMLIDICDGGVMLWCRINYQYRYKKLHNQNEILVISLEGVVELSSH